MQTAGMKARQIRDRKAWVAVPLGRREVCGYLSWAPLRLGWRAGDGDRRGESAEGDMPRFLFPKSHEFGPLGGGACQGTGGVGGWVQALGSWGRLPFSPWPFTWPSVVLLQSLDSSGSNSCVVVSFRLSVASCSEPGIVSRRNEILQGPWEVSGVGFGASRSL